jgi:oligoribonuclease NrnB/cAMP/cGMP phosphodiesterase (DHH superfamily)
MTILFTHRDVDGHGCAVLGILFFTNIQITYSEVDTSDRDINAYLDSANFDPHAEIFITDIPINQETAKRLDAVNRTLTKVHYIDHHLTSAWTNKYSWATSREKDEKGLCSGTSLFYEYLLSTGFKANASTDSFVEQVRRWDTWEWKNIYNDLEAKKLNDYLKVVGPYRYEDKILANLKNDKSAIDEDSDYIIKLEQERNDDYIQKRAAEVSKRTYKGMILGIVFADRCVSELGNYICDQNPDIDVAVLIEPSRSISLRSVKENIDCSVIAKSFGGGGHKFASGFPVPKGFQDLIIDLLFKE